MKKNQFPLLNSTNNAYHKPHGLELHAFLQWVFGEATSLVEESLTIENEDLWIVVDKTGRASNLREVVGKICNTAVDRIKDLSEKEKSLIVGMNTPLGSDEEDPLNLYRRYEKPLEQVRTKIALVKEATLKKLRLIKCGDLTDRRCRFAGSISWRTSCRHDRSSQLAMFPG
jgi:hypothetical protein